MNLEEFILDAEIIPMVVGKKVAHFIRICFLEETNFSTVGRAIGGLDKSVEDLT